MRSSSSTATPPRPTCGAMSCRTWRDWAASSPATSSAWGRRASFPTPAPAAITSPNSATTFSPCGTPSTSATTWCWSCTTGARRWASTGPISTATASRASPSWRASSSPSPGMSSRAGCGRSSRASAPPPARRWCWSTTCSSRQCCRGRSCARSPTRRWTTTGRRSPSPAKADGGAKKPSSN